MNKLIPKSKSGIHIKKENKGKFTKYCNGKVTSECIAKGKRSSDPAVRKRATFAANARKWKHEKGDKIHKPFGHNLDNVIGNGWSAKFVKKHEYGGLTSLMTKFDIINAIKQQVPEIKTEASSPIQRPQLVKKTADKKPENPSPNDNQEQPEKVYYFSSAPAKPAQSNSIDYTIGLDELLKNEGINARISSGYRQGAKTKQGNQSHHSYLDEYNRPGAYDIVATNGNWQELKKQMIQNENVRNWMTQNGYGLLDETTQQMMQRTGATGQHFHIGKDKIALSQWNELLKQNGYVS